MEGFKKHKSEGHAGGRLVSCGGPGIRRNVQPNGFGITMSEIQPYVFTESSGCLNVYNASEWGKCKTIS